MNTTRSDNSEVLKAVGTIHRVDTSTREIMLIVNTSRTHLGVPPDCVIRVNGERVKMRLLQQGDVAEVAYSFVGCTPFAHSIQVNWLSRVAATSKERSDARSAVPSAKCPSGGTENNS